MPQLGDTVELIVDLPEWNLRAGMRGAVAHLHTENAYGIEFINDEGETLDFVIAQPNQFMVVWRNATRAWVPIAEQAAAIVAHLPSEAGREVLDFARFLAARAYQNAQQNGTRSVTEKPILA